jgi:hypothetical protein
MFERMNKMSNLDDALDILTNYTDRWKERSRTYQGIADAMAEQWGGL